MRDITFAIDNLDGTFEFVQPNQSFTLDGIQYPMNWTQLATDEEIAGVGLLPVALADPLDILPVFIEYNGVTYTKVGDVVQQHHSYVERPIDVVKEDLCRGVRERAQELLRATDWYIIRQLETGAPIPADVSQARAAIRDRVDAVILAVEQATSDTIRSVNTAVG